VPLCSLRELNSTQAGTTTSDCSPVAVRSSDDELKFGDVGDEDEDSELDEAEHAGMLAAVTNHAVRRGGAGEPTRPSAQDITEVGAENEFGLRSRGDALTAADLVGALGDGDDSAALRKRMSSSAAKTRAKTPLAVPLGRVATERTERGVAYEATSKEVSTWQPTVKRNREASQLRFNADGGGGRKNLTTGAMSDTFKPTTGLETEIEKILEETGMKDEVQVASREEGVLAQKMLTKEEVQQRQTELRKRRSLMFHQEMKLKRVKKIKSRKFRKLNKRQREKDADEAAAALQEAGGEAAEEAQLKEERARARERMTLRHKNNSKWVKRQLALGRNTAASEGSRQAIAEQLRLGERLRRKVTGEKRDGMTEAELEDDEEAADAWLEKTRREMADQQPGQNLWADPDDASAQADAKVETEKGLLGMRFMQRAAEKQQTELKAMLDQLEEEDDSEGDGDAEKVGAADEDDHEGELDGEDSRPRTRARAAKSKPSLAVGEAVGGTDTRRRVAGGLDDGEEGNGKHLAEGVKQINRRDTTRTNVD